MRKNRDGEIEEKQKLKKEETLVPLMDMKSPKRELMLSNCEKKTTGLACSRIA